MIRQTRGRLAALALVLVASPIRPQEPVPTPLEPWIPWVLAQHPELDCPLVGEQRFCAWPGRLRLDLDDGGGRFDLEVVADRDLDLELPGDPVHWPQEVKDGDRRALLRRGERPAVRMTAGTHRIAGRFRWSRLPESLAVPPSIALIDLRLRGRPVRQPRREDDGLLWLAPRREGEVEQERLDLEVQRRIDDGVPVKLTTRLELRVSGKAREVDLGPPLPAGFELVRLGGQLPLRLAEGEHLVVQVRPGRWEVTLEARSRGPVTELALAERAEPWPEHEVWVFGAEPAVRAVRLGGAPGIDPQRTTLPEAWRSLPAFQLVPGGALTLTEIRRGQTQLPPDSVTVERSWWLAQDGDRITVRDDLGGLLHQGGRLEALAPAELGRATLTREGTTLDQVLTLGPESGLVGVEARSGSLALIADLTYRRGGTLPAVGWNRDAQSLQIRLLMPPGWTLVGAWGVDQAGGSWIDRWTLLDFFLLLILTLATWKLDDWRWGALTLLFLGLAWHEPLATGLWIWWLALLPLRALLRVLDEGRGARLVRGLRWLVLIGFAIQIVVFCSVQWRTGLFPQREMASRPGGFTAASPGYYPESTAEISGEAPAEEEAARRQAPAKGSLLKKYQLAVDPNAVVQTGPGVPSWSWNSCDLRWTGPVSRNHELRLFLVSPGVELVLSLLRIAGIVLLGLFLIDPRRTPGATASASSPASKEGKEERAAEGEESGAEKGAPSHLPRVSGRLGEILPALVTLGFSLLLIPARAAAQVPSPEILQELEGRLTKPPACHPNCVEVARLGIEAGAEGLSITAEVHAAAVSAWRLPGPAEVWRPARVELDGEDGKALRRSGDGFLMLRLEPGVHRVELSGPASDSLVLRMPLHPRTMTVSAAGWTVDGFRPDEPPPGSLRFDRQLPVEAADELAMIEPEAWLELRRELVIGLTWAMSHELRRFGPSDSAVLVRVPLLAGEALTTAGITVDGGTTDGASTDGASTGGREAIVRLEPGETSRRWESTLEESPSITLTAPVDRPWMERWELVCSPIWSCRAEGLVPTRHMQDNLWRPLWQPWPGEQVTFHFLRPAAAPGQTRTVDSADLALEPGRRLLEGSLRLRLRASRGGEQTITFPAGTTVRSFQIDGSDFPFQDEGGRLVFTLEPGSHEITATWRQDHGSSPFERLPEIRLDGEAVNVGVTVTVPAHRWLLWAGGPGWGPVVQLWEYLAVLVLVAWALGRWAPTPLRALDWLLLGAGMTQVPLLAAAVVVLWLLALALRDRWRPRRWWTYDFAQLTFFFGALVVFGILYAAVHAGLLVRPDMQVVGPGSYGSTLHWYVERSAGALPRPWLLWLPLWIWRVLMLGWSLWLASRLLRWLPWCWQRFTLGPILASPKAFRRWMERSDPSQGSSAERGAKGEGPHRGRSTT